MGRVIGAGTGRKHANYGLAYPSTKESRQARKSRDKEEAVVLRQQLADLQASIPQRVDAAVEEKLGQAVANKVNALMPTVVQSVVDYFASGGKGPAPMISLGGSNSYNVAPRDEGAQDEGSPREDARLILVTPAANNAGAREDSLAMGVASSPSVTCTTPSPGPSTLAELDALTVIN